MYRMLMAVCILFCFTGCASKGDTGDQSQLESIGHNASASSTDYTVTTRGADNTAIVTTTAYGRPGVVTNTDAGFCWITKISGSFRGAGEFAVIGYNASGYYQAKVQSNTSYDSTSNVGPIMTVRCRPLTDFISSTHVTDFTANFHNAFGTPTGGTGYGQNTDDVNAGSIYPWSGLEGRLNDAGSATWMLAAADHGGDVAFARWAQSCPLGNNSYCQMNSSTWEIYSALHTWTYTLTGSSASNTADVTLTSSSGTECYIDGVWGYWTATSEAKVIVEGDGNWHLVTTQGSAALGMGAYASCFPIAQGF